MQRDPWFLRSSILFALFGVATIVAIGMLDKEGRLGNGRLLTGKVDVNFGTLVWIISPFVILGGLCAWWRHNRMLAGVGLAAMAAAVGMIIWGTVIDYLGWRDIPFPQDQITYLGTFFGFLGALAVCLAYGLLGTTVWLIQSVRRKRASRA